MTKNSANQTQDNKPTKVFNKAALAQLTDRLHNKLPSLFDTLELDGETLTPTKNQREILRLLKCKSAVFVNGPLGTGKTFWACYGALEGLANGKFKKLALTAPVVEADEQLGFLKGDMKEKMEMHVLQMLETIDELISKPLRTELEEAGMIEIAPHAFNRGRTYKNTIYILDESQNASARQLMTSIGRLGLNSTFVYMGDNRQNDRTVTDSAYDSFMERFAKYKDYVGRVDLKAEDVRRHPFLTQVIENGDDRPLDGFEDRKDSKIRTNQPPQPR